MNQMTSPCVRGAVFALLAVACDESPTQPSGPVALTRLGPANASLTYASALATSQRLVVRDQATWQQTWSAIWSNVSPQPSLPDVDFSREMVIVAALGQRPTGGFSILLSDARIEAGELVVTVRSLSPGPGCAVTLAMTAPVDVARVSRRDGQVTYDEVAETLQCG